MDIKTRINTLHAVLTDETQQRTVDTALSDAKGDWSAARESLKEIITMSSDSLEKLDLANTLADWSDDNVPVVKALTEHPDVSTLRDVALHFNVEKLAAVVELQDVPETITGTTDDEKKTNLAIALRRKLFASEPTAVLRRMVDDAEVPIADANVRAGVATFLANQPEFNIRATSVYTALRNPEALKDIPVENRAGVAEQLKNLQRVQAFSPTPEAVPVLMKANLTSAFHVSEMAESTFLSIHSSVLGEDNARQVHTNATNICIRNEHAIMAMREVWRGTGLTIFDGHQSSEERSVKLQAVVDKQDIPLNLETLFGSMDYCECEECQSVYSPAAYFVELLQYLRNNNLDPNNLHTIQKGIADTPLEMLFRRRPDLGCLELTCENTNTILPYVDLVNEVMESFVVHLNEYNTDPNKPKQARLEVFNVEDEISSELLAQPQHTNYQAYCILKHAVYPFTLPYHQPIDAARIFLKYLGTSRYELLDTYRTATETCPTVKLEASEQKELQGLHQDVLDRAVDAEFLGLTQEEYIILTKQAFWPKRYFEITQNANYSEKDYQKKIGVKDVHEYYYSYSAEEDMLGTDENQLKGLTFVKKQFLPRTGVQYTDLVELLKTKFINPNYPQGKALVILESIRFSYRFLQTLVDTSSTDRNIKFAKIIEAIEIYQPFLSLLDAMLNPDPCQKQKPNWSIDGKDLRNWVYCYFERIGKLIVLESGDKPQLPIEGKLFKLVNIEPYMIEIGYLHKNGTIEDLNGNIIGNVTITGQAVDINVKPIVEKFKVDRLYIKDTSSWIDEKGLWERTVQLNWLPVKETCDLEKVRLTHLDGSTLTADEYDRIQRFIRLWRKMGWTIDETDKALIGLSSKPTRMGSGTPAKLGDFDYVGFDTFIDECNCTDSEEDYGCPDIPQVSYDITPDSLHQLVAVRKLLDRTGLPLLKLLTFWSNISTSGEKSLYSRLFLTHNLLGIDKVFQADAHGNYLTQPAKITEHIPVLMATFKLKADDIATLVDLCKLDDTLTLTAVSTMYRHSLLAKILHVKITELADVIALFKDPFISAHQALDLLKTWGKMEDAGFTFRQLDYVISGHDDVMRPLAPAQKTILRLTKTLYDGLNAIDRDHPDAKENKKEEATAEIVRTKAGLLFDQPVLDRIVGLLEGTTLYTTNAPANKNITVPEALAKKLKYNYPKEATQQHANLQVMGILTEEEKTQAISKYPEWAEPIARVGKQAHNFFNDVLSGIFLDTATAKITLLAGDVNLPTDQQETTMLDPNTAPAKRLYFLQHFLPFLRQRLTHRLIVDTLSSAVSLPNDVTDVLLSDVLVSGTSSQSAISALEQIKEKPAGSLNGWKGYLIPSADEAYTFIATSDTQPTDLLLDGQAIPFPHQQEDPSNVWSTDPTPKLKSGKLYWLEARDQFIEQLQWKTTCSPKMAIPDSALLPDYSSKGTEEVLTKLHKAAILINGFNLSADEVSYWQTHPDDFNKFNFNTVTLQHWLRLQAYTRFRDKSAQTETTLLDLFKWACKPDDAKLCEKIAAVTRWKKENIEKLITAKHFDLNRPETFRNELALVKMQKALDIADKIGVDIDSLFEWAKPTSKYWICHQIAEDIRNAARSRYDQEDWEKVVKPLNDQLREDQKQALISYILVQQVVIDWGVVDADSLIEFFLIDVQMDACRETSRIKQAISTVQLFIQRCMLGLEESHSVPLSTLDRDRWEWMQRYRVWEANRKVFLYPENWIEPTLRDDKSPFYKELESELLQKDINTQTVENALKNYLFKVDEVANLKVVGLFLQKDIDEAGKEINKLHVFSRTRNAPYFFYYRYFNINELNWYPWVKVQVDIPSYDVENEDGKIINNGTYLIPVIWNKRLLVFFPQFMKKTAPNTIVKTQSFQTIANSKPAESKPVEYWEIKMAWSEYRNGKWTQKQVAAEPVNSKSLEFISGYQFIPRIVANPKPPMVVIDAGFTWKDNANQSQFKAVGQFQFTGSQLSKIVVDKVYGKPPNFSTDFHYRPSPPELNPGISSLQAQDNALPLFSNTTPYFTIDQIKSMVYFGSYCPPNFYHSFVHELLGTLNTGNLDALYDYLKSVPDTKDTFGADTEAIYHELKQSYSLYNWEAAFHAPMLCVDRLLKSQQFDQALKMCHYVFNPMAKGTDEKRFWQFLPFKEIDSENVLEKLFMGLQAGKTNPAINEWRDKPFQPHVIARQRPSAYMKWVVIKYIEILIAYGDFYFRQKQNMLEAMPMAIQCYVLASHIYGPRQNKIPKRGKIQPQTYNSLLDKWDAFSNAMVELELVFPYSNQTSFPIGVDNGVVGLANIFGFASTLYFCIPDNPELKRLRDIIDERLFNIRHCRDIEGVFFKPPLFEPPIEPGLLVQAAAQGLSLASVLNDLDSPMPNYRFYYLLQKALELCTELKALGNAFLTAKEKGDTEQLSQLRAKHESSIHNLVMEVKKQQLEESQKSLEALNQSRKGPVYRLQHYLKLIGEDLGKVPNDNTDFSELPNQIEQPVDESGLKLIRYEKEEMDKASDAKDIQIQIGNAETLASILHTIPDININGAPIGVGITTTVLHGLGNAAQAIARSMQNDSTSLSFQSTNSGRKAGFLRQLQDRVQQANIAGYEIKNIDKQILTQQIRINIANQEITNQQKQIDNAQEVEEYLRNKYTNEELYSWMEGQIRTLNYQAYTLAYDLAKKVEKTYRFERGLTTSNFIQFGYWEAAHDGLLAGERLYISLKQLEAVYLEKRGYDYEIPKPISLRQLNPLALIQLKVTGICEFALPEVLFDMDRPGHYMRRIKSVALTIPCVVGPYTSLNCTLRLLEHKFRTNAIAKDKNDYLEKTDETDERFSTVNVPITSIAVSTGQNDSGVFELNFRDERYIPFEGAGAISKWRIELPAKFRQFDYDTITDVIMHLRYTAVDGGDKLAQPASESVQEYIKSVEDLSREEGLFASFDLKHDFPNEWYKAMQLPADPTGRLLTLNNLYERLPIFTKGRKPDKILATDVYLFTPAVISASDLALSQLADTYETFTVGPKVGTTMNSFAIKDISVPVANWKLKIKNVNAEIEKIFLLVRYVLK